MWPVASDRNGGRLWTLTTPGLKAPRSPRSSPVTPECQMDCHQLQQVSFPAALMVRPLGIRPTAHRARHLASARAVGLSMSRRNFCCAVTSDRPFRSTKRPCGHDRKVPLWGMYRKGVPCHAVAATSLAAPTRRHSGRGQHISVRWAGTSMPRTDPLPCRQQPHECQDSIAPRLPGAQNRSTDDHPHRSCSKSRG